MGLAPNIGWSANMRTIRWLLEARTHPSAEEEIRLVPDKEREEVARIYQAKGFEGEELEMVVNRIDMTAMQAVCIKVAKPAEKG